MATINLKNVVKNFGKTAVIKKVNLDIQDKDFVVFVGPSGCGKSTLLRLIAGLEEISGGEIIIDDILSNQIHPSKRGVAMVFQSYALYPHMTVRDNLGFGLKNLKTSKAEIAQKVDAAAQKLQIENLLTQLPRQLSGGQRQRVAIGRCIVRNPKVFLFDEPLSNLDASLRIRMRLEIAKLHQELQTTIIYVTHDQIEAMTLASKIVVLNQGIIEQVGTPLDIYQNPANLFVARFIGSPQMNLIACDKFNAAGNKLKLQLTTKQELNITLKKTIPTGSKKLTIGIRPQDFSCRQMQHFVEGTLQAVENLGSELYGYFITPNKELCCVTEDAKMKSFNQESGKMKFYFDESSCHIFAEDGTCLT